MRKTINRKISRKNVKPAYPPSKPPLQNLTNARRSLFIGSVLIIIFGLIILAETFLGEVFLQNTENNLAPKQINSSAPIIQKLDSKTQATAGINPQKDFPENSLADQYPDTIQICHSQICVEAEIADSEAERQKGLMHREQLEASKGMIFIWPETKPRSFWMEKTLIPLDIIFLDENKKIVAIEMATPCESDPCPHYSPIPAAQYVLEVNKNFSWKNNFKIGDYLKF